MLVKRTARPIWAGAAGLKESEAFLTAQPVCVNLGFFVLP